MRGSYIAVTTLIGLIGAVTFSINDCAVARQRLELKPDRSNILFEIRNEYIGQRDCDARIRPGVPNDYSHESYTFDVEFARNLCFSAIMHVTAGEYSPMVDIPPTISRDVSITCFDPSKIEVGSYTNDDLDPGISHLQIECSSRGNCIFGNDKPKHQSELPFCGASGRERIAYLLSKLQVSSSNAVSLRSSSFGLGTFAIDQDNRRFGYGSNRSDQAVADQVALNKCNSPECKVVFRVPKGQCGAIAFSEGAHSTAWGGARRLMRKAAEKAAIVNCEARNAGECELSRSVCER